MQRLALGVEAVPQPVVGQPPVQLLGRQRLLGRGGILGVEVVVRAALGEHLGLHRRPPGFVSSRPRPPGQEDVAVVAGPGHGGPEEVLEGADGALLVGGGDEKELAAGVDRRLDGVEELRQLGHEVGLVDERQRARVGAAGAGGEGQGTGAVGEDPARLVGERHLPGAQVVGQPVVHAAQPPEQLLRLLLAQREEQDGGRRLEEHQPQRIAQGQPGDAELARLEDHELAAADHRLERLRLRRPELEAHPVLGGGVVDPDAVAHEGGDVTAVGGPLAQKVGSGEKR